VYIKRLVNNHEFVIAIASDVCMHGFSRELFENIVEEKLMVAQVMRRSLADELWVMLYLVENSTAISINHWFLDMGFCVLQQPRQQDQDRQGTNLALKLYPG